MQFESRLNSSHTNLLDEVDVHTADEIAHPQHLVIFVHFLTTFYFTTTDPTATTIKTTPTVLRTLPSQRQDRTVTVIFVVLAMNPTKANLSPLSLLCQRNRGA